MTNQTRKNIALVITALSLLVLGVVFPQQEDLSELDPYVTLGTTNFTAVTAEDLTATDDLAVTDDATIGGDVTVTGAVSAADLTATDDLVVTDDTTLSSIAIIAATTLTVTDGYTLTPTVTTYHLDSAGAVTMTLNACATDGQLLILFGDDANNIIVADSNIRTTTGSALTIGQYDIAFLMCETTEWIELLLAADS